MATTYDLMQEDYAEIKVTADDTFKVRLLKRKDRPAFIELQNKIKNKQVPEGFDIVEILKPYVFEEEQARFEEIAGDFTFYQLEQLSNAFFNMNGMDYQAAKDVAIKEMQAGE